MTRELLSYMFSIFQLLSVSASAMTSGSALSAVVDSQEHQRHVTSLACMALYRVLDLQSLTHHMAESVDHLQELHLAFQTESDFCSRYLIAFAERQTSDDSEFKPLLAEAFSQFVYTKLCISHFLPATFPVKSFQKFPLGNALDLPVPANLPEPSPSLNFEIALNLSGLADLGLTEVKPIDDRFLRAKHASGDVIIDLERRCGAVLPPKVLFRPPSSVVAQETPEGNIKLFFKDNVVTIEKTYFAFFHTFYDNMSIRDFHVHGSPGGWLRLEVARSRANNVNISFVELREADGGETGQDDYDTSFGPSLNDHAETRRAFHQITGITRNYSLEKDEFTARKCFIVKVTQGDHAGTRLFLIRNN